MANAQVFRQQLLLRTNAMLGPAARSAHLARVARGALADLQSSGRASPVYKLFVDGRAGLTETQVRGDGTGQIRYEFSYIADAAVFALDFLRARSPAGSGKYRNSFWISVDGRFMPAANFQPSSVPPRAEIIIGNTQPYNRKVDVQMNGTVKLSFSVPPGEYDDCVEALKRRFGNSMTAKRVYDIDFPGKYRLVHAQKRQSGRYAGRVVRGAGEYTQSPAIIINPIT